MNYTITYLEATSLTDDMISKYIGITTLIIKCPNLKKINLKKDYPYIKRIWCNYNCLTSLIQFKHFPNLQMLDVDATEISSLKGIEHCSKLKTLICGFSNITSLEDLKYCPKLISLSCICIDLVNLQGLKHCPDLEILNCSRCMLRSLQGIEHVPKLTYLECFNNDLETLQEIENLPNLKYLICYDNLLRNLKGIECCSNLLNLDASNNGLKDWSSIIYIPRSVTALYLQNNNIFHSTRDLSIDQLHAKLKSLKVQRMRNLLMEDSNNAIIYARERWNHYWWENKDVNGYTKANKYHAKKCYQ